MRIRLRMHIQAVHKDLSVSEILCNGRRLRSQMCMRLRCARSQGRIDMPLRILRLHLEPSQRGIVYAYSNLVCTAVKQSCSRSRAAVNLLECISIRQHLRLFCGIRDRFGSMRSDWT